MQDKSQEPTRKVRARKDKAQPQKDSAADLRRLKGLLLTDELTGLYNKKFFFKQLEAEIARTRATGQPCSVMMMGLDDFHDLNRTFGQDAGDRLLVQLGGIIWRNIKPTDFACRFGGDEFCVIMPASTLIEGIDTAKRIRFAMINPESMVHPEMGRRITASIGLAAYEAFSRMSVDDFFSQVDREMRQAKKTGKNQICCSGAKHMEKAAVSNEEKAALSRISQVSE